VEYVFGPARNARLQRAIGAVMQRARLQYEETGTPAKLYTEFRYQTKKTWTRARRVVGTPLTLHYHFAGLYATISQVRLGRRGFPP
jgi:hypothetical protein